MMDKSQSYFWTPEWQSAEREAQSDIDEGRAQEFESVDDLLADLHARLASDSYTDGERRDVD